MDVSDEPLPISALQHLAFCPRQWGLIHLEQAWRENRLTAEGRLLHENVDLPGQSNRNAVRTVRGLPLHSAQLGLTGRADVVEFTPDPYPVEYKRGRAKPSDCDLVQLCAQALCLEEMLGLAVRRGAFFYGTPRRRLEVLFTAELQARTKSLIVTMHELYRAGITPDAQPGAHCQNCSLVDMCLPRATSSPYRAGKWLKQEMNRLEFGTDDE